MEANQEDNSNQEKVDPGSTKADDFAQIKSQSAPPPPSSPSINTSQYSDINNKSNKKTVIFIIIILFAFLARAPRLAKRHFSIFITKKRL